MGKKTEVGAARRGDFEKKTFFERTPVVFFGAMVCCALWGSAFPCIKIGYRMFAIGAEDTAAQILFAGVRFFLAGILVIAMGGFKPRSTKMSENSERAEYAGGYRLLLPKKGSWIRILKLSALQTIAQYLFFYIGLAHTTGVKASIVEGLNVFVAIFVSGLVFHMEKITAGKVIGSVIGFLGVILVNLTGEKGNLSVSLLGDGFVFLSTVAYAFSSVLMKRYGKYDNPVLLSGYQFLVGGFVMAGVGLLMGGRLPMVGMPQLLMLLYLAVVSAAAYTLWGILVTHNPISKVAVFGFMNPVFGVILSAWLLPKDSGLRIWSLPALLLVCAGICIVNTTGQKTEMN